MPFGNWRTRPKQMGPNEIIACDIKPKQMEFGNQQARPFGAKAKQMAFYNWPARQKQIWPNEIS